jgi:hypothetical protein
MRTRRGSVEVVHWRSPSKGSVTAVLVVVALLASCSAPGGDGSPAAGAPRQTTTTVRYGPFAVPPAKGPMRHMHGMGGSGVLTKVLLDVPKPCEDCWLTGFRPELTAPDGRRLGASSDVMLHHLVLADGLPSCGVTADADPRFFAAGSELSSGRLPNGYGYRVPAGDRWGAVIELMNSGSEQHLVYVDVAFRHTAAPQRDVVPLWLDVGPCPASAYAVPAGRSVRARTYTLGVSGRVIAAVGHLHPGGVRVSAVDQTTGRTVCTSRANASLRTVRSMGECVGSGLPFVHRGDRLRITSVYDSPEPERGAMGIMLAFVAPR